MSSKDGNQRKDHSSKKKNPKPSTSKGRRTTPGTLNSRTPGSSSGNKSSRKKQQKSQPYKRLRDLDDMESDGTSSEEETLKEDVIVIDESPLRKGQKKRKKSFNLSTSDTKTDTSASDRNDSYSTKRLKLQSSKKSSGKSQHKTKCKSPDFGAVSEPEDILLESHSSSQESNESRGSYVNMEANVHPTNRSKSTVNAEPSPTGKMCTKTTHEGKNVSSTNSKGKTQRRIFRRKINYAGSSSNKKRHISTSSSESDSENSNRCTSSVRNLSGKTRSRFDHSGKQNSAYQTGCPGNYDNEFADKSVKAYEKDTVNSSSSTVCSDDDLFLTQTEFIDTVYNTVSENHLDTPSVVKKHDGDINKGVATQDHSDEDSDSTVMGTPPQEEQETQIPDLTLQFISSDEEEDIILIDMNANPPDLTPQSLTCINIHDENDSECSMPLLGGDGQEASKDDPYKFPSQSQNDKSDLPPFKRNQSNIKTSNGKESSSSSDDVPLRSLLQSRLNRSESGSKAATTSRCELEDKDMDLPNLSCSSRSRSNRSDIAKLQKKDSNCTEDYWEEKQDETKQEVTLKKKESDATEDYWKEEYKSDPINSKKCDDEDHVAEIKEEPDNLKYGYTQENDTIWLDYDDDEDFQMSQPVVVISSDEEEEESQSMLLEDRNDDDLRHFFNIQDLEFEEDLKLESEANQNRDHHMHKGDYSPRGDRVDKSQEKICSELYSMETQIDDDDFDTKTQYDKDSRTHGEGDIFDAQTQIDGEKVSEDVENTVPYVIDESDEDDSYMYGALTQVDKSFSSEDNDLPDICDDDDDHSYDAETQYDRGHVDEADEEFYAMETQADVQLSDKRKYEQDVTTQGGGRHCRGKDEMEKDSTRRDLCVDDLYGTATQIDVTEDNDSVKVPSLSKQSCDRAEEMFRKLSDSDDDLYNAQTQLDPSVTCNAGGAAERVTVQDPVSKAKKLYTTNIQVSNQSDRPTEKPRPTTTAGEEQRRKEELTIYEANTQVDGTDVFGEESDTELFEAATQFDPVSHQKFKAEVMDSDFVTGLVEKVVDNLYIASTQVDNTRPCQTDKSDHVTDREHSSKSLDKHNNLSGIKITGVYKERSYVRNSAASNQCQQNGEHLSDIVVKDLSGGDLPSSDIVDGNACTYNRAEVFLDLEEDDAYDAFTQVDTDKHPVETDQDVEKDKFQEIVIIDDEEEEEDVYNQPTQVDLHDKLGSSSDIEDVDMVKQSTSTDQDKSTSESDFDWYSIQTQIGKPKIDDSDSEKDDDNEDNLLSFHGLRMPKDISAKAETPQKTGLLSSAESNSEVTGKKNIPNRLKLTPMKRKAIVIDAKPQKTLKEKRDSFTIEKDSFYSTKQKAVKRTDSDATGGTSGTWLSKGPYAEAKLTKTIATRRRRPSKSKAPLDSASDLKKKMLEAKTKMAHRASEKIAEQVPHAKRQKTQRETRCGDVSDVQMPNEEEIRKKGLPLLESLPQKRRSEVIQDLQNISLTQSSANTAMPSTPYTESDISSHKERDTSLHKEMDTSSNKERNSSLHKEIDTSSLKDRDTSSYTKTDTSAKTKESLLIESKSMFSRKRDEDKDRRDSSHREKDSSHKESDSSHRKRDSSSRKERDCSSRREKDNSSHRERDSSSHKERDSSHKERDSLSRRERDSSSRRERDSSSRRERDSSSCRERDSSSHRERESSSQRERDSSSHRERDSSSHKERDSSSHKEMDSSSHREKDSSSNKESDSSSHRERESSSHRERVSSSRTKRESSSHRKRDNSSHRKTDSVSHKEKDSSYRERDLSHKESHTGKDSSHSGKDSSCKEKVLSGEGENVAHRNGILGEKQQENSLKVQGHISHRMESSCTTLHENARDSSPSINQAQSSGELTTESLQRKDEPSKSENPLTSEASKPQVSTSSSDKILDAVSLSNQTLSLSLPTHEPQISNVKTAATVEPQGSFAKSAQTSATEKVTTAQTTGQPQAVMPKSILTKGKEKRSRKSNVTFCLDENTAPPPQDLKYIERKQPQKSADLNQPIREPVRPLYASLMQKPVSGVSNQVMGPGLPELPGLQTGMSNRTGKPLGDITSQGQLPVQSITLDHFLIKLLKWNPVWFNEQEKCKTAPPQIEEENPLFPLIEAYSSYSDYVKIFMPHLLFETWEMACHGWKQQKQQGCPHLPVCLSGVESSQEKQLMTFVCYYVTSKRKYNQGMCPNEGDLVVNHTYILAKAPPPQPAQPPKEGPQFYPTLGFVEKVQPYWRDDMNAKIMGALPLLRREADKIQPRQDRLILCMRIKTKHRPLKLLYDKPSTIQHVVSLVSLIRQFVAMTTLPQSRLMQHILEPGNHGVYGETHLMTKTDRQQLSSYNSSQQRAICTAAKVARQSHILPRVCLLQGPPGTGKSHTIVGIIDKIVKDTGRRARICLCAPSNAAVDELVRKFTAHKKQMTKKHGNYILRLVRIGNVKSLHGDVVRYSFNEVVKKTIETEIKLKNEKNIPESTRNELQSLTKKIDVLKKKLDDLRRKQEFVQVKRDELDLGKLERKKRDLETQCNKMFRDVKLTSIEEVMIKKNVLWKAHVICGTLNSFGSSTIQNLLSGKHENQWFNFDCVIIDEASQATELDCLIPLQYNTSKLIMVGDPEQLPPTVLSKMAADKCFGQSLFERLFGYFRFQDKNPVHLLDTQYRMDPQIAAFPSQYIYQGKLKSDVSVEFRCKDFPLKPYIVFDLVAGQEITSASGSVSNKAEADFTVALCSFILSRTKMPQSSIGIIAPYQSQKSILTTLLHQHKMPEVEVGTVDGFQGREKQVIVLSCVRARSATGGIGFLADRRRMNVSLTRARSALYVVGHLDSLEQAGGDWKMLIQDARNRGMVTRVGHQQNYHNVAKVCWKPR